MDKEAYYFEELRQKHSIPFAFADGPWRRYFLCNKENCTAGSTGRYPVVELCDTHSSWRVIFKCPNSACWQSRWSVCRLRDPKSIPASRMMNTKGVANHVRNYHTPIISKGNDDLEGDIMLNDGADVIQEPAGRKRAGDPLDNVSQDDAKSKKNEKE
jgi:hypothetical protein